MWRVVLVLALVAQCLAAPEADRIASLPGLKNTPTFKQYSGYLKATGGRQLHYWFVESTGKPKSDPVVLWLNGGPGCSSMDGLLSEHGPFRVSDDGFTLVPNAYSWNRVANMLYLEAPAGVGFSFAPDKNYTTNDDQTSLDNYWALKYFFKVFPEFAPNPFFLSGESYGGIYIPTLGARVVDDKDFNFQGFMVGNGLSDRDKNSNSMIYYAYYHGIIGQGTWEKMVKSCCGGEETNCDFANKVDHTCRELVLYVTQEMWAMNVYNMYAPCYHGPETRQRFHPFNYMLSRHLAVPPPQSKRDVAGSLGGVPPCVNVTAATAWLNRQDVRNALHISNMVDTWVICSDVVQYTSQYDNVKAQYLKVLAAKKRIMVYNGDADMACNFLGDEWFVNSLQRKETKVYRQWHYKDATGHEQIAGFTRDFDGIRFVTVKGAGHMVPQDKPEQSLLMFKTFLDNQYL